MVQNGWSFAVVVVFVLTTALVGGCIDPDPLQTTGPGEPGHRYSFTEREVTETNLSAEGAFLIVEHCIPLCWTGQEELYTTTVDLTDLLPVGVPVLLNVTLRQSSTEPSDISGRLKSDGAWTRETEHEYGRTTYKVTTTAYLPHDGAKLTFVISGFFPDTTIEHEWTLSAQAYPLAGSIPTAFPVAFKVPDAEKPPAFDSLDGKNVTLRLWGPDNEFLGKFNTKNENAADMIRYAGMGEYVVFAPTAANQLTIETDPDTNTPPLKALAVSTTIHDYHEARFDERVEWQFELEKVPLALAIGERKKENEIAATSEPRFWLETPTGSTLEGEGHMSSSASTPANPLPQERLVLEGGHPDLATGGYTASWTSNGFGVEAAHIIRDYVR